MVTCACFTHVNISNYMANLHVLNSRKFLQIVIVFAYKLYV